MAAIADDKKVSDLMKEVKPGFFSFEYFPPKTADGVTNLKKRMQRMKALNPLFMDFTWGAGGSTSDLTLDLTAACKNEFGVVANMHLTCTNQTASLAEEALDKCKAVGVRNIVALRGDAPRGMDKWEAVEGGFNCALDLVKMIRAKYGDYFTVSVAGYPEGHPDAIEVVEGGLAALTDAEKRRCRTFTDEEGKEVVCVARDAKFAEEMTYLKAKIDAGSDFIITQMFLDVQVFHDFVKACREYGINVPIIPGIMCLTGYGGFTRMTALCKTRLPAGMAEEAKANSATDDDFKQWGIEMGTQMCRNLLDSGVLGIHFYTLNLEKVVVGTLKNLGLITEDQAASCQAGDADAKSMVSAQGITTGAKADQADGKVSDLMKTAPPGFFSFEYFPPKTADGVINLKKRMLRMKGLGPLFMDFTWGAGGSTSDLTIDLVTACKNETGVVANMHLTCTNQTASLAEDALNKCKAVGVRNIVALRGDAPRGMDKWEAVEGGFTTALDLVKMIREKYGDYFTVSVAGYPEGHPDAIETVEGGMAALTEAEKRRCRTFTDEDGKEVVCVCRDGKFAEEMNYLKSKMDAGSDFIITQMFLDVQVYHDFVAACREYGITQPIIPGIMCLTGFGGFQRMTSLCKTRLPAGMLEAAQACANDEEFKQWGITSGTEMCKNLYDSGAPGLHFYTLNLEKVVVGTLKNLGKITAEQAAACSAGDGDAKTMVSAQGIA